MRRAVARRLAALAALAAGLGPAVAAADEAVVLPVVGGQPEISEAVRAEVEGAVVAGLETEGWTVRGSAATRAALPAALRGCVAGQACVGEVVSALDSELAVGIVIWGTEGHPERPRRVVLVVAGLEGVRFEGTGNVEGGDVVGATRAALRTALARFARGIGPFLAVSGTAGAIVEVDGEEVGQVPLEVRAEPGERRVRVRLPGYATEERTVQVASDPTSVARLEVELRREATGSGPAGPAGPVTAPDPLGFVLAAALAAAGLGTFAALPLPTLLSLGVCLEEGTRMGAPACAAEVGFGPASAVLTGVAGALLVAGVVLLVAQPLTVTVTASPRAAGVEVRGSF